MSKNFEKQYQILDVSVMLSSDSEEFMSLFERDYGWFGAAGSRPDNNLRIIVTLHENSPCVRCNDECFDITGHPAKMHYACQIVLKKIFDNIRDYLVLHAGVVSNGEKAFIFSGHPGIGKTTLVIELIRAGFRFFSDDYCPVHCDTRLVHPFPRSLWVKNHTEDEFSRSDKTVRYGKSPITADQMIHQTTAKPCPVGAVLCMDADAAPAECVLKMGIRSHEADIVEKLRQINGVTVNHRDNAFPDWEIRYAAETGLTSTVRQVLETSQSDIWNVYREDSIRPDFSRVPDIRPISQTDAALHLIRDIKNSLTPRWSASEIFMKIYEFLEDAPCYRLTVGRLDRMTEAVLGIIR